MEIVDFDRQFRRMELADTDAEVQQLSRETLNYINSVAELKEERVQAWEQALARQRERSAIELATFRKLMGIPISA